MADHRIDFLGEEDYIHVMNNENKTWRNNNVRNGNFTTRDKIKLNYYKAENPKARAAVIIVHGYCEFWGKYHEYAWYLWQAGYTVYFLEQRCHGYSEGKLPEADVIHIDSFSTYAEDLWEFLDQVVKKDCINIPLLLLAHSMGGAVACVFLEKHTDIFAGALLSSPMLKIKTGNMSPLKIKLAKIYMILAHKQKSLSPGQHHFNPNADFANSSTLSEARYNYLFNQRLADSHYQTAGASLGWVMSAIDVYQLILKDANKITTPVVLMQAGLDNLVEPEGFDAFMAKVPQARKYFYENSKHEIYNAKDEVRKQYFKDVLDQLDQMM